jgi:hypothetical protein
MNQSLYPLLGLIGITDTVRGTNMTPLLLRTDSRARSRLAVLVI